MNLTFKYRVELNFGNKKLLFKNIRTHFNEQTRRTNKYFMFVLFAMNKDAPESWKFDILNHYFNNNVM